ncbi:MAG: hypothetical protein AAF281_08085 [Pseudomonadota bacterium]
MSAPAILALLGILAGTLCLILRRAARRCPDPGDTGLPSALGDALTGWVAWVSLLPMIGTLAMLTSAGAGLLALATLAAAHALPPHPALVRFYPAQIPLAAATFLLSILSGISIVTGAVPDTP